jgi:hypothetical protein
MTIWRFLKECFTHGPRYAAETWRIGRELCEETLRQAGQTGMSFRVLPRDQDGEGRLPAWPYRLVYLCSQCGQTLTPGPAERRPCSVCPQCRWDYGRLPGTFNTE